MEIFHISATGCRSFSHRQKVITHGKLFPCHMQCLLFSMALFIMSGKASCFFRAKQDAQFLMSKRFYTKEKPVCRTTDGFIMRVNSGFFLGLGQSALHIAAAQATGAHVHPLRRTVNHHADALHIGRPGTVALAVGVTHIVAVHRALFANLTKLSHEIHLLREITHIKA